ncbi:NUDIX hydrolase domain-like protein [Trichoderma ceciliae]
MAPYAYTFSAPLAPLASQPPKTLCNGDPPIAHLMTSVLVLRQFEGQAQILLVRRSPSDSYPLKWECPGGSVDGTDASVLDAAARELWEETSLKESRFHAVVGMARQADALGSSLVANWGIGPQDEGAKDVEVQVAGEAGMTIAITTFLETRERWGKINLVATTSGSHAVVLDPEEHVEWGWFSEEEVRMGRAVASSGEGGGGGRVLEFTSQAVWGSILGAFEVGRELGIVV